MKSLPNLAFSLGENKTYYSELVTLSANNVPAGGIGIDEQRRRIHLLDMAERAGKDDTAVMTCEDKDAEKLKELVAALKWSVVNADLVKFADAVDAM